MKMKQKNKKVNFFLSLSVLTTSILGMPAGKRVLTSGDRVIREGEGTFRMSQDF